MNSSKLGHWLIVGGASKSGTTALYYYLRQHPDFCLSKKKELHFFSRSFLESSVGGPGDRYVISEIPKTLEQYLYFYRNCKPHQVAVDISPSYLFHSGCAELIKKELPDSRLLFILRNPVEKAYSQFMHLVGEGREDLSFEEALEKEMERKMNGYSDIWLYKESGFYASSINHFIDIFGKEMVEIFYYDEFLVKPQQVLRDVCRFAGVDETFHFKETGDINRSGYPKSIVISKLIAPNAFTYVLRRFIPSTLGRSVRKAIKNFNTGSKPLFSEDTKKRLMEYFLEDIRKVELIVGRPSGWI